MNRTSTTNWSAAMLRRDLAARALHYAQTHNLLHDVAPGDTPAVLFGRDEAGRHGNFHPQADARICAHPAWLRRLDKAHTASRRSRARKDWPWRELDSANSSDALLMSVFCHPGVFDGERLAPAVVRLLNADPVAQPCFGITPGVPLRAVRKARKAADLPATLTDRTEIDLQFGSLFVEAKLTETGFQTASLRLIERYRDLEEVFDTARLPRTAAISTAAQRPAFEDYSQEEAAENAEYSEAAPSSFSLAASPARPQRVLVQGYQLIRNVLAAWASDAAFCVLCDARRHDLIEAWYAVLSAVHHPTFACRLKLLTWQELATALPQDLQTWLDARYGITPA